MQGLPTAADRRVNYDTFDGLRGIAAIAVLIFHLSPKAGIPQIIPHGYLAVDLFFGLSGFVIAQAYSARLKAKMGVVQFTLVRLVRLYPLFILGQLFGFFVLAVGGHNPLELLTAMATGSAMMPFPVSIDGIPLIFPLNSPAWSLFFEVAVNVLFAISVVMWSPRFLALIVATSAVVLSATTAHFGSIDVGWNVHNLTGGVPRVLFSFLSGVLLAAFASRVKTGNTAPALLMLSLCFILAAGLRAWWFDLLVVLFFFPLMLFMAAGWQPYGAFRKVCHLLGRLSYPIYIIHAPALYLGEIFIEGGMVGSGFKFLAWTGVVIAIVTVSALLVSFYDEPVRRNLVEALKLNGNSTVALQFRGDCQDFHSRGYPAPCRGDRPAPAHHPRCMVPRSSGTAPGEIDRGSPATVPR